MESVSRMLGWIGDQLVGPGSIDTFAYSQICEMAHEIEAEVGREYIKLPLDADGVPIRVGDMMVDDECNVFRVAGLITKGADCWSVYNTDGRAWIHRVVRHYRKPTIEYVLRDFGVDIAHALDADPDATVPEATIAEYAAKLREVMGDD